MHFPSMSCGIKDVEADGLTEVEAETDALPEGDAVSTDTCDFDVWLGTVAEVSGDKEADRLADDDCAAEGCDEVDWDAEAEVDDRLDEGLSAVSDGVAETDGDKEPD